MTKHMMKWFLERLRDSDLGLKQVEAYEGQLEDPEDTSIFPPAAFVVINRFTNEVARSATTPQLEWSVDVYLVSNHLSGSNLDAMLDLMDGATDLLHDAAVRWDSDDTEAQSPPKQYIGRCLLSGGEFIGILPGTSAYRLGFTVR